jgi:hypothetical protein
VNGIAVRNIGPVRPEKSGLDLEMYGRPGVLEEKGLKYVNGPLD